MRKLNKFRYINPMKVLSIMLKRVNTYLKSKKLNLNFKLLHDVFFMKKDILPRI